MKLMMLSGRTMKEILRDPLNLFFGLGFPLVILFLLTAIQAKIPMDLFGLESLVPGITVFGLSFFTLFSALLVSRDRETAFLQRLYTAPLKASDFIMGYALPFIPIALLQGIIVYAVSFCLGLKFSVDVIWALLGLAATAFFFIGMGVLCGSVMGSKQVGGICGALFTNLTAWLSGTWFDVSLVGSAFETIANLLPFIHAVEMERALLSGNHAAMFPHFWWVLGYAIVSVVLAIVFFLRQMKRE